MLHASVCRPFVVVSGLPGSGKSTLAQRIAPQLGLALIDKDDILERLFEEKGTGDADWRRKLSRESDLILQREASESNGAVLVSHWRLPGMPSDSGTPTEWLAALSGDIVNVHCQCDPEIAAQRFARRVRHAGHRDCEKPWPEILRGIREIASLGMLDIRPRVIVDTSGAPAMEHVLL